MVKKRVGYSKIKMKVLQLRYLLFVSAVLSLVLPSSLQGAVFKVNSTFDINDLSPGNGLCVAYLIIVIPSVTAVCTLRAAIEEANSLPGEDTIYISSGTYSLSQTGGAEDESATGDLDITDSVRIVGAGSGSTILNAAGLDRMFDVREPGIVVSITGVSIVNGSISSGQPSDQKGGGGIRNFGSLFLDRVMVQNNHVHGTESGDKGGGIKNLGTCSLSRSSIEQNSAHEGGGFANSSNGTLFLSAASVSENFSSKGGGGLNYGWTSLQNSTVSGNSAQGSNSSYGGGLYNMGVLEVVQSTIAENNGIKGGGISNIGSGYLLNSIVAMNSGGDCRLVGNFRSQGNNLDGDGSCGLTSLFEDITTSNPRLGPLADNGGLTKTHRLLPGSLAIDAGQHLLDITTDQRGVPRPQRKGYDIGAVEQEAFSILSLIQPLLLD